MTQMCLYFSLTVISISVGMKTFRVLGGSGDTSTSFVHVCIFFPAVFKRHLIVLPRLITSVRCATAAPRSRVATPTREHLSSNLRATPSPPATPRYICPTLLCFIITNLRPTTTPRPSPVHLTPHRYSMLVPARDSSLTSG